QATTKLASGVPFISDADLKKAMDDANVPKRTQDDALDAYSAARIDGLEAALAILGLATVIALMLAQAIPNKQPGST
ncbi:MAG TPA: hypothetical protein VHS03_13260, partial [Gaiellaceae bacterium]|nr:hypothetical protein [Gaiellaceae bacterium]